MSINHEDLEQRFDDLWTHVGVLHDKCKTLEKFFHDAEGRAFVDLDDRVGKLELSVGKIDDAFERHKIIGAAMFNRNLLMKFEAEVQKEKTEGEVN